MNRTFSSSEHSDSSLERAQRWLARFAPFVYEIPTTTADECRALLTKLRALKEEGGLLAGELSARGEGDEAAVLATLRQALPQIDGIEEDLRRRLARLAPGDPDGVVDLDALRQRLAQRAAEEELGPAVGVEVPTRLEHLVSKGGLGQAMGIGCFGVAWTSFTLFHSIAMIGGMWKAFGPGALLLLLFYSLFYAVGIGMLAGAVNAASTETLELDGRTLIVRKTLGSWVREKRWTLAPGARARVDDSPAAAMADRQFRQKGTPVVHVLLQDEEGKDIRFGASCAPHARFELVDRINAYLSSQPTGV